MKPVQRISLADQVTASLREGIREGRWAGALPGVIPLAMQLGVSRDSMREALWTLEQEGWIASHGNGRRREVIAAKAGEGRGRTLRVAILPHERLPDQHMHVALQTYLREVEAAGHICVIAPESQSSLRFQVDRIARMVKSTPADVWIVLGASQEILEWFAAQKTPAIAVGGKVSTVKMASTGVNVAPVVRKVTQQLIDLGHRRIVLACPPAWRGDPPGMVVSAFRETLQQAGIEPTSFHLPDWEEDGDSFDQMLTASFRLTPPTALIVSNVQEVVATLAFLGRIGMKMPRDVSLVALCYEPALNWCRPRIAQVGEGDDVVRLVKHVVRWIEAVAQGKEDRKMVLLTPVFQPGESFGPVRNESKRELVL